MNHDQQFISLSECSDLYLYLSYLLVSGAFGKRSTWTLTSKTYHGQPCLTTVWITQAIPGACFSYFLNLII